MRRRVSARCYHRRGHQAHRTGRERSPGSGWGACSAYVSPVVSGFHCARGAPASRGSCAAGALSLLRTDFCFAQSAPAAAPSLVASVVSVFVPSTVSGASTAVLQAEVCASRSRLPGPVQPGDRLALPLSCVCAFVSMIGNFCVTDAMRNCAPIRQGCEAGCSASCRCYSAALTPPAVQRRLQ